MTRHRYIIFLCAAGHGQFGSGATWWQIAPRIADQGYRVIAVDLPGHGESPPDVGACLDYCVEQVATACPTAELAMGRSLGSLVLAHCAHRIGVQRAISAISTWL